MENYLINKHQNDNNSRAQQYFNFANITLLIINTATLFIFIKVILTLVCPFIWLVLWRLKKYYKLESSIIWKLNTAICFMIVIRILFVVLLVFLAGDLTPRL